MSDSIQKIAQNVAIYNFTQPTYEQVISDTIDLFKYLKGNPSDTNNDTHKAIKSLFWELVMRTADANSFSSIKN